jgi:ribonuclease BN (tRNA processing enzyme)
VQLAELATQAKPGVLILYHHAIALRPTVNPQASSSAELLNEVSARYSGHVVVGHDLDIY